LIGSYRAIPPANAASQLAPLRLAVRKLQRSYIPHSLCHASPNWKQERGKAGDKSDALKLVATKGGEGVEKGGGT